MRTGLGWVGLVALLLAGCPGDPSGTGGVPSNVDKDRLAVLQREPVLKLASGKPYAEVGFATSAKLPVHRSKVVVDLADDADPPVARKNGAQAMDALRDSGWTVFYTRCERFSFTASAYKVQDGVSYYAELTGVLLGTTVSVALQMRAPYSKESTSDLFADRPPAITEGQSCLETDTTGVSDGTEIVLDELGPEPNGTPKPAGHR